MALLIWMGLGLAGMACEPAPPRPVVAPTSSPTPVAPIVLGAILDAGRDAGPEGRQRYEGAMLAVEVVNRRGGITLPSGERRPLQLTIYDDAGQAEHAEPALRRLLEDGALAVIGPSDPGTTAVVRLAAETAGMPLVTLDEHGGGDSAGWRWTFSLVAPPEEALAATIDFFAASGVDRFGWLAPRTMEASSLRRALMRMASGAGMQVVSEEAYAPGEESHGQRLARIQAGNPRVILGWPRDAHEAASIAREVARVPNLAPLFLGPTASNLSTLSLAGDAGNGVRAVTLRLPVSDELWDHDVLTPVIRDFRREFLARHGRLPTSESAGAWDVVRLIVATLEGASSASGPPSRAALRDGLESTTDYPGASGVITFGPRRHAGLDRRAFVVARADGRRWRLPP